MINIEFCGFIEIIVGKGLLVCCDLVLFRSKLINSNNGAIV